MAGVPGVAPLDEFDPRRLGAYVLLGRLGAGGMGSVYLGRRDGGDVPGPLVAIKVIRVDLAGDPGFRRRFALEAHAAQRVHHSYTAAVLDVDVTGSRPYLVTEYIEGPTLGARVRDHGPLAASNLVWLAGAVAEALRAIHTAGVIHRDLKPANILLSLFGSARVIDFGIARALDVTTMATQGTIGTPAFMAPEQVLNQDVTAAADIHAWGAVLAFAATGRVPFGGDTIHTIMRQILETTPDLGAVPDTLRPLATRALAKSPADRPTAADLVDALAPARHLPTPRPPSTTGPASNADAEATATITRAADQDDRPPASTATATVDPPATLGPPKPTTLDPRAPTTPEAASSPWASWVTAGRIDGSSGSRRGSSRSGTGGGVNARWGAALVPVRPPRPRRRRWLRPALAAAVAVVVAAVITTVTLTGNPGHSTPSASTRGRPTTSPSTSATSLGRPLTGPTGRVDSVAFSPDGRTLAAGTGDDTVWLWDVSNPANPTALGQPLTGPTSTVDSVAFSPDGHTLAAGTWDHTVWLWDVTNPANPTPLGQPLTGPTSNVWTVAFSPDGHTLAAGSDDQTVRLWKRR